MKKRESERVRGRERERARALSLGLIEMDPVVRQQWSSWGCILFFKVSYERAQKPPLSQGESMPSNPQLRFLKQIKSCFNLLPPWLGKAQWAQRGNTPFYFLPN